MLFEQLLSPELLDSIDCELHIELFRFDLLDLLSQRVQLLILILEVACHIRVSRHPYRYCFFC